MEQEQEIEIDDASVCFDYQPQEFPTLHYPGCDAEVTLNSMKIMGIDFDRSDVCEDKVKELEQEIINRREE